jgi:Rrf2 family protein
MRISAKGEYAIRALLDLAMHDTGGLVAIQDIAGRQSIPPRFLEQVLLQLKRAGLLTSKRGAAGGYHLRRPPDEITVGDALRAVEGATGPFEPPRGRYPGAAQHDADLAELWNALSAAVSEVIDQMTFGDLASRVKARRGAAHPTYHI